MSYLVLARKYRPRNFTEMVGQDHVVQALTNALTTRRLHHAWLFTGTRGVGKTTVSRILAKSLNCQGVDGMGGITATPCGVCQACTDIDAGRFVDYTELDAASNRGVGEVQVLLEQAVYKPVQGRFKVFMIDEVHMLTGHAFNAMLKTLEEPPGYLKFVLATTDPQKVPVTVLSRCLQFNLRPMAPETIREHLTQVLALENVQAEVQALRLLSRAARGSMRDALSLTDQAIAFGAGQLQEAAVRLMLGSVDRSYVFRLIEALALGDGKTVVETCEALRTNGLSAASTLEEMSTVLQRMAVVQALADPAAALADDADPEAADTTRLAALLPADETQLLYSICLHGRADLGLAPDEYAALTMVLLRLLAFKPAKPAQPGGSAPSAEKKTLTKPEAPVVAVPKPPAARVPDQPRAVQPWEDEPVNPPVVSPMAPSVVTSGPSFAPSVDAGAGHSPASAAAATGVANAPLPPGQRLAVRNAGGGYADDPTDEPMDYPGDDRSGDGGGAAWQDHDGQAPATAADPAAMPLRSAPGGSKVVAVPVREQVPPRFEAQSATTQVLVPTEEGALWHATVMQLVQTDAIGAMVRELALQSQLVARDTDQWLLRVEQESLNQQGSRDRLASALQAAGHAVQLVVEIGRVTDSPGRRNAAASAEKQLAAEKLILETPFVQAMMRDFGATIVPGSIRPLVA